MFFKAPELSSVSGYGQKEPPIKTLRFRGWSTVYFGSASEWHSEGQGFDPPRLHQMEPIEPQASIRLGLLVFALENAWLDVILIKSSINSVI